VTLVAVGVPREYYVGAISVEHIPEGLYVRGVGTVSGGIARVVEVGQGALRRVVGEVSLKPLALGRARIASAHLLAVAVKGHDVPASQIVAVVALAKC
jgi:hypothetical protein